MRYMLLLKGEPRAGGQPDDTLVAALAAYIGELVGAGILLAAEGLHPSSMGARIRFAGGGHTVVDDPVGDHGADSLAGYLLIEVRSREEAIAWATRCPADQALEAGPSAGIEVRRVFDLAAAG
jgi:hypothetical protein